MPKQYRLIKESIASSIYSDKFGKTYDDEIGLVIDMEGQMLCIRFWINNDFGYVWAKEDELIFIKGV